MSMISELTDEKLVDRAIMLDKEKKTVDTELNTLKAEIQKRGLQELLDHNTKYCKLYGARIGTAIVSEAQEVDVLNMDRLSRLRCCEWNFSKLRYLSASALRSVLPWPMASTWSHPGPGWIGSGP